LSGFWGYLHPCSTGPFRQQQSNPIEVTNHSYTKQLSFRIFPNPASNLMTINLDSNYIRPGRIEVYDSFGKVVYQNICNENAYSIDISDFANGIYLIKFSSSQKFSYDKIIVTH
jgi:hypothetical protein